MHFMLLALSTLMVLVSADTITLPLYSRAFNNSGVDVPVTDWFSRTDNQVSHQISLHLPYKELTGILPQWYTTISVGTPPQYL